MKGFKGIILAFFIFAIAPLSLLAQPYSNSPTPHVIIPEVIWAEASGGGTWITSVQIIVRDAGDTDIWVNFHTSTETRGPFLLWQWVNQFESRKISNILSYIQTVDGTGYSYYGKVGALSIFTNNMERRIYASARTYNGGYSKTIPGLNRSEPANTCSMIRELVVPNLQQNEAYRTAVALYNEWADPLMIEFGLVDENANTIGSTWTETINGYRYMAFNPFVKAGAPAGAYTNCWLIAVGLTGNGAVMAIGATVFNGTNDPACHIAYQFDY
jgi:hypothetical protein